MTPKTLQSWQKKRPQRRRWSLRTPSFRKGLVLSPTPSPEGQYASADEPDWNPPPTTTPDVTPETGSVSTPISGGLKEKSRKSRKLRFSLFKVSPIVKVRPSLSLTKQFKSAERFVDQIKAIRTDSRSCSIQLINELEEMEKDLLKRLETVRNMKLGDRVSDTLIERKYRVISQLEEKILAVQTLAEKKERDLKAERRRLLEKHTRFVCCEVCEKEDVL